MRFSVTEASLEPPASTPMDTPPRSRELALSSSAACEARASSVSRADSLTWTGSTFRLVRKRI